MTNNQLSTRYLDASIKGCAERFAFATVTTPIISSPFFTGAATCITVDKGSLGLSAVERAPYSPRKVK